MRFTDLAYLKRRKFYINELLTRTSSSISLRLWSIVTCPNLDSKLRSHINLAIHPCSFLCLSGSHNLSDHTRTRMITTRSSADRSQNTWLPPKANFRRDPTQPIQMNKVFSNYPHPQRHFIALPEDFDQWFTVNHFIPGPMCCMGDVPSEKVICTVQLNRTMVWRLIAAQLRLSWKLNFLSNRSTMPTISSDTT